MEQLDQPMELLDQPMGQASQRGSSLPMMQGYRADIARYGGHGIVGTARTIFFNQGLWALAVYRFFHPLVTHPNPLVRKAASPIGAIVQKLAETVSGVLLPNRAEIGPGLYVGHFGPIIINQHARIGANCYLGHNTTLGNSGRSDRVDDDDAPVLGDRVYLGAGAVAIGPITIGDDCVLGANATVTKSLPARAVAVGNPAKIVSMKGSFRYVWYADLDDDPARLASLAIVDAGTESIPETT
jgi:serine O-acetyltransferase